MTRPMWSISPDDAEARLAAQDALLVDLREGYERSLLAVDDALPLPLYDLLAGTREVPDARLLILMDQDGSRGAFGVRTLAALGRPAVALQGGAQAFAAHRAGAPAGDAGDATG